MNGAATRPASKKNPGTSSDVTALSAGKVERARLYAGVGHAIADRPQALVVVAGECAEAPANSFTLGCGPDARTIGWKSFAALVTRGPVLLIFAEPAPRRVLTAALEMAEANPRMEACFLNYAVWLPGGVKNPCVDRLNARINASARLSLTGYILDPEGRPGIIVGRHE
ncbi:MAG: hypothetical protein F9K44_16545 [Hyphomicrobiaceae bacterium]|nr:MAG: hypothetical protein F9K44_16545 [Hyphomicrobiaceae bacterium]